MEKKTYRAWAYTAAVAASFAAMPLGTAQAEEAPAEDTVKTVEDGADALNVFVYEDKRKGEAVRKARNEAGFSVRELADLIGYDSSIIVNWENGLYKISPDAEDALKKLFGDNLFNKEGEAE